MKKIFAAVSVGALIVLSNTVSAEESYRFEDVVHLTCEEVAAQVGDNPARVEAIVRPLAEYSLAKRSLSVPEGRPEIGQQFGELLKAFCTAEPDGLFYNAVDRAIRRLL
ncbi:MAG TPA: YmgD family protein [Rhodocyclaceae bacterium]|nr:YmgD family protein [Zoogloeaceae bacterium]HRD34626.1 YmgD family protein [Rhodocyclaceae bacterium]